VRRVGLVPSTPCCRAPFIGRIERQAVPLARVRR
jgi:hypothetical protein